MWAYDTRLAYCALRVRLCFIDMINTAISSTRSSADPRPITAATAAHPTLLPLAFGWEGSDEIGPPSSLSGQMLSWSWTRGAVKARSSACNRKRHIGTTSHGQVLALSRASATPKGIEKRARPYRRPPCPSLDDLRSARHRSKLAPTLTMYVLVKNHADGVICGGVSPRKTS